MPFEALMNAARQGAAEFRPGAVHVWYGDLDLPRATCMQLAASLPLDERQRAARFRSEQDRQRFLASRGLLRAILAGYLGHAPGKVRLECSCRGKPCLATGQGSLRFNLSHADRLAAVAVTMGREVGVDLERLQPAPGDGKPRLGQACRRGIGERQLRFLRAWTRKEALLKAGDLAPAPTVRWSVRELPAPPGYVAALAVAGPLGDGALQVWPQPPSAALASLEHATG
jgi:4'-phosphopantetheinyl transferase